MQAAWPHLQRNNFRPFEFRNGYFYSTCSINPMDTVGSNHIGSYRVQLKYAKCGKSNVMAQLIQGSDKNYTFRKWNPEKLNLPAGSDTSQDVGQGCCYLYKCVNFVFNSLIEEVVFHHWDGKEVD